MHKLKSADEERGELCGRESREAAHGDEDTEKEEMLHIVLFCCYQLNVLIFCVSKDHKAVHI